MYPISYLTLILIILLFFDKKLASYFYPFIFLTSTFGIFVTIYLIYSPKFRNIFYNIFPSSLSRSIKPVKKFQNLFFILIILFKIVLLVTWPINITYHAFLLSTILIFLYIILYYFNSR